MIQVIYLCFTEGSRIPLVPLSLAELSGRCVWGTKPDKKAQLPKNPNVFSESLLFLITDIGSTSDPFADTQSCPKHLKRENQTLHPTPNMILGCCDIPGFHNM